MACFRNTGLASAIPKDEEGYMVFSVPGEVDQASGTTTVTKRLSELDAVDIKNIGITAESLQLHPDFTTIRGVDIAALLLKENPPQRLDQDGRALIRKVQRLYSARSAQDFANARIPSDILDALDLDLSTPSQLQESSFGMQALLIQLGFLHEKLGQEARFALRRLVEKEVEMVFAEVKKVGGCLQDLDGRAVWSDWTKEWLQGKGSEQNPYPPHTLECRQSIAKLFIQAWSSSFTEAERYQLAARLLAPVIQQGNSLPHEIGAQVLAARSACVEEEDTTLRAEKACWIELLSSVSTIPPRPISRDPEHATGIRQRSRPSTKRLGKGNQSIVFDALLSDRERGSWVHASHFDLIYDLYLQLGSIPEETYLCPPDLYKFPGAKNKSQGKVPDWATKSRLVTHCNTGDNHWVVVAIEKSTMEAVWYDSLASPPQKEPREVVDMVEKAIVPFWGGTITYRHGQCKIQEGYTDCGIMAACNADSLLKGIPPNDREIWPKYIRWLLASLAIQTCPPLKTPAREQALSLFYSKNEATIRKGQDAAKEVPFFCSSMLTPVAPVPYKLNLSPRPVSLKDIPTESGNRKEQIANYDTPSLHLRKEEQENLASSINSAQDPPTVGFAHSQEDKTSRSSEIPLEKQPETGGDVTKGPITLTTMDEQGVSVSYSTATHRIEATVAREMPTSANLSSKPKKQPAPRRNKKRQGEQISKGMRESKRVRGTM